MIIVFNHAPTYCVFFKLFSKCGLYMYTLWSSVHLSVCPFHSSDLFLFSYVHQHNVSFCNCLVWILFWYTMYLYNFRNSVHFFSLHVCSIHLWSFLMMHQSTSIKQVKAWLAITFPLRLKPVYDCYVAVYFAFD